MSKVHYAPPESDDTACGRYVYTFQVDVTDDREQVTCEACLGRMAGTPRPGRTLPIMTEH